MSLFSSEDPYDQLNQKMIEKQAGPDKEQELQWAMDFKNNNDKKAFRKLVRSMTPLITKQVNAFKPDNEEIEHSQLMARAIGHLPGIIKKYEPGSSALNTWVTNSLRGHLQNATKESFIGAYVPREFRGDLGYYQKALSEARHLHGPNPTDAQVMALMPKEMSNSRFQQVKSYFVEERLGDATYSAGDNGQVTFRDLFQGKRYENDTESLLQADYKKEKMEAAMKKHLSPQEIDIIKDIVFDKKKWSQVQIARGVSSSKVQSAIKKWNTIQQKEGISL